MKEKHSLTQLAEQVGFSQEFILLTKYVDEMKYDEYPNYQKMHKILSSAIMKQYKTEPENRLF